MLTSGSDLGTLNCLVEPEAQLKRGFVRTEKEKAMFTEKKKKKEKAISSGPSQISISMYHVLFSVGLCRAKKWSYE